jgi:hypothetical protein
LHIFKFEPWFMHWQQGGEIKVEKSCIASLEPIPRVKGELVHFFLHFWLLVGVVCCMKSAWPVLGTGLTGFGNRSCMLWWFCLGCVEPLPLPKGSETCLLQVIFLFAFLRLSIRCWSFFYSFLFFFLFSLVMKCVLSMHSSRGRFRTMCGSRTGGWLLPDVMSDWQHCLN